MSVVAALIWTGAFMGAMAAVFGFIYLMLVVLPFVGRDD